MLYSKMYHHKQAEEKLPEENNLEEKCIYQQKNRYGGP